MRNLHQLFVLCTASQIIGGDFAKFCGLLRIFELYKIGLIFQMKIFRLVHIGHNLLPCLIRVTYVSKLLGPNTFRRSWLLEDACLHLAVNGMFQNFFSMQRFAFLKGFLSLFKSSLFHIHSFSNAPPFRKRLSGYPL